MAEPTTLADARAAFGSGLSAAALTDRCLAAAEEGEGPRAVIRLFPEAAREAAAESDRRRAKGAPARALEGVPLSVKDLFDVRGVTTLAGSRRLADGRPAAEDSVVVARLREAGAVVVGTTNMSEFAFSGVGLNPHYGTPLNPWDRAARRVPGGSSSGAAVSVSDAMALAAIGTDTGGSVRIPAALCGLVGYKPTARLVSMAGAVPLSASLDSVGAIGRSLACCETLVSVLSGQAQQAAAPGGTAGLRLGVVRNYVADGVAPAVATAFERALSRLSAAGAALVDLHIPALSEIPAANSLGGFAAAEAFAWHRPLLNRPEAYDPRVLSRIERGRAMTAADYIDLLQARARITRDVEAAAALFDALVCPTAPILAPRLSAFDDDGEFARLNLLLLRNPTVVNFIDGAAVSLPCHTPGDGPVGLMLWTPGGTDGHLLAVGRLVEAALAA